MLDLEKVPIDFPEELKDFIEQNKEKCVGILRERRSFKKRLKSLLNEREEVETVKILNEIIKKTKIPQFKEVAEILLSNEKLIKQSTILRWETSDSTWIWQATLEGTFDSPNPQVFVLKYNDVEQISQFRFRKIPFEEKEDEFYKTVLHELIHSFTTYIVSIFERWKDVVLSEEEKEFYNSVFHLHKNFLEKHKTWDSYLDKLDEFIAKTIASSSNWNWTLYMNDMTSAFEKMYQSNTRNIVSLSKYLRDSLNQK